MPLSFVNGAPCCVLGCDADYKRGQKQLCCPLLVSRGINPARKWFESQPWKPKLKLKSSLACWYSHINATLSGSLRFICLVLAPLVWLPSPVLDKRTPTTSPQAWRDVTWLCPCRERHESSASVKWKSTATPPQPVRTSGLNQNNSPTGYGQWTQLLLPQERTWPSKEEPHSRPFTSSDPRPTPSMGTATASGSTAPALTPATTSAPGGGWICAKLTKSFPSTSPTLTQTRSDSKEPRSESGTLWKTTATITPGTTCRNISSQRSCWNK